VSVYVLQPVASTEERNVVVARNVHVAAALTATYRRSHHSVPAANPTNSVFAATDIYCPSVIQKIPTTATRVRRNYQRFNTALA